MVARAMANFGLSELRLVNPRDGWPSEKARAAASKADHVIDAVRVFDDLPAAIADLNFVFATTARARDGFKKVGMADEIVTFPVDPGFASLNIAQAVLLMSYEWMKSGLEDETRTNFSGPDMPPATKAELFGLFSHLEAALETRGYFRPAQKKPKMVDNLRSVLTRAGFAAPELRVLRGVIASLDYFTPKEPRGAGYPERKARADRDLHAGGDDEAETGQGRKELDDG